MTVSSKHDADLLAAAENFAESYVRPQAVNWTNGKTMPRDVFTKAAEIGLTSMTVPEHLGGRGASFSTKVQVTERLARVDFGVSMAVVNSENVAAVLSGYPSVIADSHYLTELMSGDRIGCVALTEAQAGSDFTSITTRAERRQDGWALSGEKRWITNATHTDTMIVYAQTGKQGDGSGIGAFLVDGRREGFARAEQIYPMGLSSIGSGGLRFENYIVPEHELVDAPGSAFKAVMNAINGARIYVAAMSCGMLQSAIDFAGNYGATRVAFGQSLDSNQGWRFILAEAAASLAATRALVDLACKGWETGQDLQLIAAQAKIVATRMIERHLPAVVHAMGAEALRPELPLQRHLVASGMCSLIDGSTEMLLERVARSTRGKAPKPSK